VKKLDIFFRKEASKNQIAKWKKAHNKSCPWRANPHKCQVIGKNKFSPMLKEIVFDCDYTNPLTNTGYGARRCGISAVGNAGVGPSTIKQYLPHSQN